MSRQYSVKIIVPVDDTASMWWYNEPDEFAIVGSMDVTVAALLMILEAGLRGKDYNIYPHAEVTDNALLIEVYLDGEPFIAYTTLAG